MHPPPLGELAEYIRILVANEVTKQIGHVRALGEYLTTEEAGELARVATGTVRRWIREGRLPSQSAGREIRIRRSDLERLMTGDRKKREPSPEALAADALGGMRARRSAE